MLTSINFPSADDPDYIVAFHKRHHQQTVSI